jgi:arylsulfatase A-like enzyme
MKVNRREFVKTSVAAAVAAGVAAEAQPAKSRPSKPNVLYLFSDQHRAVSLPGEVFNEAKAPNIDAFRRANFSMDTCVSNYPLCAPYRGVFMSGRWPTQTGVMGNDLALPLTETTMGDVFKAAGYQTAYVGKWHLSGHQEDGEFIPPGRGRLGFDYWRMWGNTNDHYASLTWDADTGKPLKLPGWNATAMTDQAVEFLKKQPAESAGKPWFLVLSWNPPHPPFDPPAKDQAPYGGSLKMRPNVMMKADGPGPTRTPEKMHKAMEGYYGGITGIDLEFARVLKTLEETGQADNTIVIYTSDHGEMLGSQGRMSKQVPYEESCRVPFMVRSPGVTPKGGSSDVQFAAIDIYPTVCGLAGIPIPAHCEGKDMSAAFGGKKVDGNEIVFLMNGGARMNKGGKAGGGSDEGEGGRRPPTFRGARTATHTYAVFPDARWCLYDNVADPYQLKNLIGDPAQKPLMEKLDAEIKAWIRHTGDTFPYPHLS